MQTETYQPGIYDPMPDGDCQTTSVRIGTEAGKEQGTDLGDIWLDVKEVSRYLHVSRSTLYSWIRTGLLPASHVGRQVRINREKLDEAIESGVLNL